MPGFPVPLIRFREDDPNGHPLAGGKLYSYAAGTSTRLATYTTAALNVANENPTILDASGRASIYIEDGVGYKFALYDALENLLYLEDGVEIPKVLTPALPADVPVGGIMMFGGTTLPGRTTAPFDWLWCDGSSQSAAMYAALYAVVQVNFGGPGGTTFKVPDMRGRFPLGVAVTGTGATIGAIDGEIDHVHTGPSHTHPIAAHTHGILEHTHPVKFDGWTTALKSPPIPTTALQAGGSGGGGESQVTQATQNNPTGQSSLADTSANTTALVTGDGGTATTGPKNPPLLALNYIIKT